MPYIRRRGYRARAPRRRTRRVGAPLGTAPRWRFKQRRAQNLQRGVYWFKLPGVINDSGGGIYEEYQPNMVLNNRDFQNAARMFEQMKILQMTVRIYPAAVGSETASPAGYHRGNMITWVDQPPLTIGQPTSFTQVMSLPSARIAQPRGFVKRWINRPRGGRTAAWTPIDHNAITGDPTFTPDQFQSQIRVFGLNFATGVPAPYFYTQTSFKVLFRSRYSN